MFLKVATHLRTGNFPVYPSLSIRLPFTTSRNEFDIQRNSFIESIVDLNLAKYSTAWVWRRSLHSLFDIILFIVFLIFCYRDKPRIEGEETAPSVKEDDSDSAEEEDKKEETDSEEEHHVGDEGYEPDEGDDTKEDEESIEKEPEVEEVTTGRIVDYIIVLTSSNTPVKNLRKILENVGIVMSTTAC